MRIKQGLLFSAVSLLLSCSTSALANCNGETCCAGSGISYCDSSSGRYVCRNGDYSTCYCTRHAVMEMDRFKGCCMWHGGVFKINSYGAVICNDSTISELCTDRRNNEKLTSW